MGDVFIKLSADEKQCVDAMMKVVDAQRKGEDAAKKHGQSWNKMSSDAQSAANTMTGGLAGALTSVNALDMALGRIKEVWSAVTKEARESAEEFKKMTQDIASAVSSVGKTKEMGAVRLQLANTQMYGMDMATRLNIYKAAEGNMDIVRMAGGGRLAGLSNEQSTDFAKQLNLLSKVAGNEMSLSGIADILMTEQMRKTPLDDSELASLKRFKEGGGGSFKEGLAMVMGLRESGQGAGALAKLSDYLDNVKPVTEGKLSPETKKKIDAEDAKVRELSAKEETLRRQRFDAAQKHDAELLKTDAEIEAAAGKASDPHSPKGQMKAKRDAAERQWKAQQDAWDAQEEVLRRQKTDAQSVIADLNTRKEFSADDKLQNELAAMTPGERLKAAFASSRFDSLIPGGSKLAAARSVGLQGFKEQLDQAQGSFQRQQMAAMSDENYAAVVGAEDLTAQGDIAYSQRYGQRQRDYALARGVVMKLTAEDGAKWKRETMLKELETAESGGVDASRLDLGASGRFAAEFAKAKANLGAAGKVVAENSGGTLDVRVINQPEVPVKNQVQCDNSAKATNIERR